MGDGPRIVIRTSAGRVILEVPLVPGTVNEVVLPDSPVRLTPTTVTYRRSAT